MSVFESKNRTFRHRNEVKVLLRLTTGQDDFEATVYTTPGERPLDLLNDDRSFLPVKLISGETLLVAKAQISSMLEVKAHKERVRKQESKEDFSQEAVKEEITQKSFNPYEMLRVSPSASSEEIRAAYKARIKAVHPDTLASLDLDEDLTKAAILTAQKVNYAYQKIMRERSA